MIPVFSTSTLKKVALSIFGIGLCSAALAQGSITFANNANTLVTLGPDPLRASPVAVGGATVQLYYLPGAVPEPLPLIVGASGLVNTAGWEPVGAATPIAPIAGRFMNPLVLTTGPDQVGGANVWLEVVGWTGGFANGQAAIAGGAMVGISQPWSNPTGNPNGRPPTPPEGFVWGTAGFSGIDLTAIPGSSPVPEPSALALVGLGFIALLHRRNK